jgi:phenylpyruvate tautomerase PptA (4-oxalocrotonate tautomerase family)
MPYLRLSSLPLDEATKRHLADELTATVLEILPHEKPEWTSVHFTPFEPGDFAIAGRLVADGAIPDTHLEISAPGVDEKSWFALRNRLTDVLIEALTIPDSERWHVNVKLNRYDLHSFAVAGNAADELDRLADDEDGPSDARRGGWGRRAATAGFVAGLVLVYRWLSARVGTDATVDAAPPVQTPTPSQVAAGAEAGGISGSTGSVDAGPREF